MLRKTLILLFILLNLFSCQKQTNTIFIPSMENLKVPANFNWKTSREISLNIHSSLTRVVKLSKHNALNSFAKTIVYGNDSITSITLNIPAYLKIFDINSSPMKISLGQSVYDVNLDTIIEIKSPKKNMSSIATWHFNESQGNYAYEQSGNYNGIISFATWVNGVSSTALAFNGENSNVDIPNSQNMDISGEFTLMLWAKSSENKTAKLAQKGDWDGFGLGFEKWNGWYGHIRLENNTNQTVYWGDKLPILNQWYHLALVFTGDSLKLFVNSKLKNAVAINSPFLINQQTFCIGSDNASQKFFNGSIDEVYLFNNALNAGYISSYYSENNNSDDDGDGISNEDDENQDNENQAYYNYWPSETYGTIMFEDSWPDTSDFDFNDMVIDYRLNKICNSKNFMDEILFNFKLKAIGTKTPNGFGFQIDNQNIKREYVSVSGYKLLNNYIQTEENGVESGQDRIVVIVFDNANLLMPSPGGFGVNVEKNTEFVKPVEINIIMKFKKNTYKSDDFDFNTFNPFLIVNKERGKEIHPRGYPPTSLSNSEYFYQANDITNPNAGIYYQTENNLPWVLITANPINQVLEKTEISSAYLNFYEWAASGGLNYTNWYIMSSSNVDKNLIYLNP